MPANAASTPSESVTAGTGSLADCGDRLLMVPILQCAVASSTDSARMLVRQYSPRRRDRVMSAPATPLLYERVARLVETQIATGTLRANDRIPSVRTMSRSAKVSVSTVVQAYVHLERIGLV